MLDHFHGEAPDLLERTEVRAVGTQARVIRFACDPGPGGLEPGGVAAVQQDGGATPRRFDRHAATEPICSAGDQNHLFLNRFHDASPFLARVPVLPPSRD
jgi:hypothetical protein